MAEEALFEDFNEEVIPYLHSLIYGGDLQAVIDILREDPSQSNKCYDTKGRLPIHIVSTIPGDRIDILRTLLENGAEPWAPIEDGTGTISIHLAAFNHNYMLLDYLLSQEIADRYGPAPEEHVQFVDAYRHGKFQIPLPEDLPPPHFEEQHLDLTGAARAAPAAPLPPPVLPSPMAPPAAAAPAAQIPLHTAATVSYAARQPQAVVTPSYGVGTYGLPDYGMGAGAGASGFSTSIPDFGEEESVPGGAPGEVYIPTQLHMPFWRYVALKEGVSRAFVQGTVHRGYFFKGHGRSDWRIYLTSLQPEDTQPLTDEEMRAAPRPPSGIPAESFVHQRLGVEKSGKELRNWIAVVDRLDDEDGAPFEYVRTANDEIRAWKPEASEVITTVRGAGAAGSAAPWEGTVTAAAAEGEPDDDRAPHGHGGHSHHHGHSHHGHAHASAAAADPYGQLYGGRGAAAAAAAGAYQQHGGAGSSGLQPLAGLSLPQGMGAGAGAAHNGLGGLPPLPPGLPPLGRGYRDDSGMSGAAAAAADDSGRPHLAYLPAPMVQGVGPSASEVEAFSEDQVPPILRTILTPPETRDLNGRDVRILVAVRPSRASKVDTAIRSRRTVRPKAFIADSCVQVFFKDFGPSAEPSFFRVDGSEVTSIASFIRERQWGAAYGGKATVADGYSRELMVLRSEGGMFRADVTLETWRERHGNLNKRLSRRNQKEAAAAAAHGARHANRWVHQQALPLPSMDHYNHYMPQLPMHHAAPGLGLPMHHAAPALPQAPGMPPSALPPPGLIHPPNLPPFPGMHQHQSYQHHLQPQEPHQLPASSEPPVPHIGMVPASAWEGLDDGIGAAAVELSDAAGQLDPLPGSVESLASLEEAIPPELSLAFERHMAARAPDGSPTAEHIPGTERRGCFFRDPEGSEWRVYMCALSSEARPTQGIPSGRFVRHLTGLDRGGREDLRMCLALVEQDALGAWQYQRTALEEAQAYQGDANGGAAAPAAAAAAAYGHHGYAHPQQHQKRGYEGENGLHQHQHYQHHVQHHHEAKRQRHEYGGPDPGYDDSPYNPARMILSIGPAPGASCYSCGLASRNPADAPHFRPANPLWAAEDLTLVPHNHDGERLCEACFMRAEANYQQRRALGGDPMHMMHPQGFYLHQASPGAVPMHHMPMPMPMAVPQVPHMQPPGMEEPQQQQQQYQGWYQ